MSDTIVSAGRAEVNPGPDRSPGWFGRQVEALIGAPPAAVAARRAQPHGFAPVGGILGAAHAPAPSGGRSCASAQSRQGNPGEKSHPATGATPATDATPAKVTPWRAKARRAGFDLAFLSPAQKEVLGLLDRVHAQGWCPRDAQKRPEVVLIPRLLAAQSAKRAARTAGTDHPRRAYTARTYQKAVRDLIDWGLIGHRYGPGKRRLARAAPPEAWAAASARFRDVCGSETTQPAAVLGDYAAERSNGFTVLREEEKESYGGIYVRRDERSVAPDAPGCPEGIDEDVANELAELVPQLHGFRRPWIWVRWALRELGPMGLLASLRTAVHGDCTKTWPHVGGIENPGAWARAAVNAQVERGDGWLREARAGVAT